MYGKIWWCSQTTCCHWEGRVKRRTRSKENIHTVQNALDVVDNLRGVSFDWKESGRSSYGVIAQELQKVLPELVHGDNPKTVNYNGIIGVLIEAIKELKKEVEELKSV